MKTATKKASKKNHDPATPIHFSPGRLLGQFIDDFQKRNKLENRQEALREIVRDRLRQVEEANS